MVTTFTFLDELCVYVSHVYFSTGSDPIHVNKRISQSGIMALSKLVWDFKSVSTVCEFYESNASKHQAKRYNYFIEQYIAYAKGELSDRAM
jgi:hypothetical protein